jgi:hypothetical protein
MAEQTFTSGQILTAAQMTTLQANTGLNYISSTSIPGGASTQNVAGCFTSTYDAYRIVISNLVTSDSAYTNLITCKLSLAGTPSSASYIFGIVQVDMTVGTVSGFKSLVATTGMPIAQGTGSKIGVAFDVINPAIATFTAFPHVGFTGSTSGYANTGSGQHIASTAYDGFQIVAASGTLTSGTIAVFGYRK